MKRTPRVVQQLINVRPISFSHAARCGRIVADGHGFGAEACVFGEAGRRYLIDFGGRCGECVGQIAFLVFGALAMDDPPFEFELRRALRIKGHITDTTDRGVEGDKVGERAFVVGADTAVFEDEGGAGGVVGDALRLPEGEVILRAQQFAQLKEEAQASARIVGTPHRRFEARYFIGIEAAYVRRRRAREIKSDPCGEQYDDNEQDQK